MLDLNPYPDFDDVADQADLFESVVIDIAQEQLSVLKVQVPNVDWDDILKLLRNERKIVEEQGAEAFESYFKTPDGDIDAVKLAAYERLALVKNTVASYVPVMKERAHNTDTNATFNLIRENVAEMRKLGFSYDDTVKFFDQDAKISKSPTPHPTEGLSINGVKLACKLVSASEIDQEEREIVIRDAIKEMVVSEDFGCSKKFTIADEAELSDFYAHNHNDGISQLERFVEEAIEDEYGCVPRITLDAALRSWDYDSDGKNNADGFAFMAKTSRTTLGAFNQIIDAIDSVEGISSNSELSNLREKCAKVRDAINPIYERSNEITKALAAIDEPKERAAYYREAYKHYSDLERAFGDIYKVIHSKNRGLDFYKKALVVLESAVDEYSGDQDEAALKLSNAFRLISRTGFALEKGQPRQNDFEHIAIIDNLLKSDKFRALNIFRQDELKELDEAGGYAALVEADDQRQYHFLSVLSSYVAGNSSNRKALLAEMYDANPLEFDSDGNGYPIQTRTLLDRLSQRQLYQLKFDQNIISDAQPGSDERMHFLFQAFAIQNGTSMSLHEDRGTLPRRAKLLKEFSESVGGAVLSKTRHFYSSFLKGTPLDKTASKDTWAIIHPASDAERGGSFGTRMESADTWRKIAKFSYRSGVTVAQMLGGGMHINRFGGNPMILFNTIAEELKHQVKKNGKGCFDRRVQQDRHIMRSATSMLFTEQGRHKRYNMATSDQVANDFARKLSRMIAVRFDLEGLVPDHTFIAPKPCFQSKGVKKRMDRLWKKGIDRYNAMRFAKDGDGAIILDKLARLITAPMTIGFKNNGARPAAKGGSSKEMTNVRAIENAIRFDVSKTHAGGFLGAGEMMRDMAADIHEGKIDFDDIDDWFEHAEWDYSGHGKMLIDAGRFDPTNSLSDLGWSDATFDELKAVGEKVRFVSPEGDDDTMMIYRGDRENLTKEQIYFAKIWYDRLVYVSHMEAALAGDDTDLNLKSELKDIIASMRPEDGSPVFPLGYKTQVRWQDVVATIEADAKNSPQLVIQRMREKQMKHDIEVLGMDKAHAVEKQGGEGALRRSGATWRAGTASHWIYWASKLRYGSMPRKTGFSIDTVITAKAKGDADRESYDELVLSI